jgi:hypothetical protein
MFKYVVIGIVLFSAMPLFAGKTERVEIKPVPETEMGRIPTPGEQTAPVMLGCHTLRGLGFMLVKIDNGNSMVIKIDCPSTSKKDT